MSERVATDMVSPTPFSHVAGENGDVALQQAELSLPTHLNSG